MADLPHRPPQAALTLGELLSIDELGLQLLTGAQTATDAPVAGAHCIEIERPSQWLEEDWIMLSTGVRLRGSPRAQRELVDELVDAGCCALGLGLGVAFVRVPAALRNQAASRGFPLFTVPLPTPFRVIVAAVHRALISAEIRSGRPPMPAMAAPSRPKPATSPGPPANDVLLALEARRPLYETLVAYLEHEMKSKATAAALGVHPNTLRYRLRRIEELTGGSLRQPEMIASLHLAIKAQRLRSS